MLHYVIECEMRKMKKESSTAAQQQCIRLWYCARDFKLLSIIVSDKERLRERAISQWQLNADATCTDFRIHHQFDRMIALMCSFSNFSFANVLFSIWPNAIETPFSFCAHVCRICVSVYHNLRTVYSTENLPLKTFNAYLIRGKKFKW